MIFSHTQLASKPQPLAQRIIHRFVPSCFRILHFLTLISFTKSVVYCHDTMTNSSFVHLCSVPFHSIPFRLNIIINFIQHSPSNWWVRTPCTVQMCQILYWNYIVSFSKCVIIIITEGDRANCLCVKAFKSVCVCIWVSQCLCTLHTLQWHYADRLARGCVLCFVVFLYYDSRQNWKSHVVNDAHD